MISLTATPVLETERLILRAPVAADYPAYEGFMASARSDRMGGPMDGRTAFRAFAAHIGHWVLRGYGQFVVTDRATGEALGQVGPWFPQGKPEREIGWSLWSGEGRGIAYEAALAARSFVLDTLGWDTAVSYIAQDNARSAALAARMGAVIDPKAAPMDAPYPMDVWRHPRRTA